MATGQALLAKKSQAERKTLLGEHRLKTGEWTALNRACRKIQELGYAEVVNQKDSGIAALATSVELEGNDNSLAIGLSLPVHRYDSQTRKRLLAELAEASAHIGKL